MLCAGVFAVAALDARSLSDVIWASRLGQTFVLYGPLVVDTPFGYLRALTSGFLHVDISHLVVNLLVLVFIGPVVERFVGTGPYVAAYLACILGGSAAVLFFGFAQPTAGASGALYGLMAILVAIAARNRADLRAPLVLVAGNLVFTLVMPGVSLWGHLGGMVTGALIAVPLTARETRAQWWGVVAALAITAMAIAAPVLA
nr:rhomboid family intramembrane serine protease [Corynebacterium sp. CCUG 71335]